jgi:hypothetical protein
MKTTRSLSSLMQRSWLCFVVVTGGALSACGTGCEKPKPSTDKASRSLGEKQEHAAPTRPATSPQSVAIRYDHAIEPYVAFLKKQKQTPVDYLVGLFDRYDIVVLAERAHEETTQYEMILQLISDPRFARQGGHVFTEVGSAALRPYVEAFLMDDQLSDEQISEKLRYIAGNIGWTGGWEKTNFYDFLKKIYLLNRSLPKRRRVHVYPSDLDFCWDTATKNSWTEFKNSQLDHRDRGMADNIINKINELRKAGKRNKFLVIMNTRHAFPHLKGYRENVAGFLMEAYPGRLANVMINFMAVLPGSTNHQTHFTAIQDGKWDAAFAVLGNPSLGFDFKESPFGQDHFDYCRVFTEAKPWCRWRYQDAFAGFVFYKPLDLHRMSNGLPPGIYDQALSAGLARRFNIMGVVNSMGVGMPKSELDKRFGTIQVGGYETVDEQGKSDCAEAIKNWLDGSSRRSGQHAPVGAKDKIQ